MGKKLLLTATVQSHICQFHRALVQIVHPMGYEVHVGARDNLAEKNGLKLDFADEVYTVPFNRSPKSPDNIRAFRVLKGVIDRGHYDVIHCNTPVGGVVTRLAARNARKQGTKVFYTAHGFHFYRGAPLLNWLVYFPVEKVLSGLTDVLITVTQEDYAFAKKHFKCKVAHIHGVGVDEKRYFPISMAERQALRTAKGFSSDDKIVLCIGELLPNKNQSMAIRAMERVCTVFPDAKLLIAGNGLERERLEQLTENLGLQKNVRFLGYCTCLEEYQHIADVLVACSRREGLPLNIVEAMLSGTSVVASDNRGHRELISSGKNGFLVPVDDVDTMAARLVALLSDDGLRSRLAEEAFRSVQPYTFENVKKELLEIYAQEAAR